MILCMSDHKGVYEYNSATGLLVDEDKRTKPEFSLPKLWNENLRRTVAFAR